LVIKFFLQLYSKIYDIGQAFEVVAFILFASRIF
jgi:hypothetical protein